MNFTECQKIPIKSFMGLYKNGTQEEVPADHFWDSRNNAFKKGKFGIRPGSSLRYNLDFPRNNFAEWVTNSTPNPIISIDLIGNFYFNNSNTPLFTVDGATDFFCVNFYSSLFICPCNGVGPVGNLIMLYYPQSTVAISSVAVSGANATYSYNLVYGPALQVNQLMTIELMTNAGNNIIAPITALGAGTFTIANPSAVVETDGIWVDGQFQQLGVGTGTNNNNSTIKQAGGAAPTSLTQMAAVDGSAQNIVTANTAAAPSQSQAQSGADAAWTNLSNVTKDDGLYATVTMPNTFASNPSNILELTNFGFSIPATATVVGVRVLVHRQQISGTSAVYDKSITLAGVGGSNDYFGANPWAGNQNVAYGSDTDTWGLGIGLNPAIINSSSFGINISTLCTGAPGNGATAGIDYVTIQVFYQTSQTGDVPAGLYQINVVYETDTGFLTNPSVDSHVAISFNAAGAHQINITGLPIGPAGTVARNIIITQAGQTEPYWFVPGTSGGVINDNTTTTTILDFFATDLVDSADYLFNVRANIPSGQGINVYAARLAIWGLQQPDNSIIRFSNAGTPETFDKTLETYIVNKDDGYFVSNTCIIRDVLYITKSKGIYSALDNGLDPINWDTANPIDQSVGTPSFRGISTASPSIENSSQSDSVMIADTSGIYLFNGTIQLPALTWKIQDLWDSINNYNSIAIVVDVKNKRFHVTGF